jgi:hypothetical protein
MLRPYAVSGVLLFGTLLSQRAAVVAAPQAPAGAARAPVAAMYGDDQLRGKAITLGFQTASLPATNTAAFPVQIYLTQGDLQRAFDESRFRPDAAIVPTNTDLQLTAGSPATQKVLIDRVQRQPAVMKTLQDQADARRGRGAGGQAGPLEIGVDTFVAQLSASPGPESSFPGNVCLIATDFANGAAIDRRELFAQDRFRRGIAACLRALDAAGAHSVVVPLVGAASSGTQATDPQYEGQRLLMECRLTNAVAGIALGIADFAATRRSLREIGIIQWEQEILGMFGATRGAAMSRAAQTAYRTYTNQVKLALRNGLAGQKTTPGDVSGACSGILNPQ